MISHKTAKFNKAFERLSKQVQRQAKEAFKLFQQDPYHPSLQFKQVHSTKPVYSARVSLGYRVVGIRQDDVIVWFWIGPHGEYDKIITRL